MKDYVATVDKKKKNKSALGTIKPMDIHALHRSHKLAGLVKIQKKTKQAGRSSTKLSGNVKQREKSATLAARMSSTLKIHISLSFALVTPVQHAGKIRHWHQQRYGATASIGIACCRTGLHFEAHLLQCRTRTVKCMTCITDTSQFEHEL